MDIADSTGQVRAVCDREYGAASCRDYRIDDLLPRLRRYLSQRLLPHEELDDAVQDGLVAVLRAAPSFRGDASFTTFAFAVAWRTVLATRRQRRCHERGTEHLARLSGAFEDCASPDALYTMRELSNRMQRLVTKLPEGQREVLHLRYATDCSVPDIVEMTGDAYDTVKSRLRAGRRRLRQLLEDEERRLPGLVDCGLVALAPQNANSGPPKEPAAALLTS